MLYYKRHIGDYIRDTAHLSLLEHGAYARLMDVYYGRESALPDNEVFRLVGARDKKEIASVKKVLSEFWTLTTEGWVQRRCDHEIGKAKEKADKNRINGQKGGRPPKPRSDKEPTRNPNKTHVVYSDNPKETLSNYPTIQLSNKPTTPSIRSERVSAGDKPKNNPDGFEKEPDKARVGLNGHSEIRGDDLEQLERVKAVYPKGIYREADWLEAQHHLAQRVEEGATWDELVAGAQRFAAQKAAIGHVGTQFIESPKKFFADRGKFRDDFPLPATPVARSGASGARARSVAELEVDAMDKGISEGKTDAQIAEEILQSPDFVRAYRESHEQH